MNLKLNEKNFRNIWLSIKLILLISILILSGFWIYYIFMPWVTNLNKIVSNFKLTISILTILYLILEFVLVYFRIKKDFKYFNDNHKQIELKKMFYYIFVVPILVVNFIFVLLFNQNTVSFGNIVKIYFYDKSCFIFFTFFTLILFSLNMCHIFMINCKNKKIER